MANSSGKLERGLKNRHIQMIALGGAIGAGLFKGSGAAIGLAGPATILAYLIGGSVIYLILRMLGEMSTEEPVAGAFSYFAYKYWTPFAGFLSGWNYWFLYILVSMAELIAIGSYMDKWFAVDHWVSSAAVLVVVTLINLISVRFFGEFEFWFALVKILAVLGMIVFGVVLIITGLGGEGVAVANLWEYDGFFPMGAGGMVIALVVMMFSFGGTELIGIAAGEAEDPKKSIPRAIHQVMWRILLFYIGSVSVIMILTPWNLLDDRSSPFVMIFDHVGIPAAGHIFNVVILTAAISVYNSAIYSNGRMLLSLSEQGNAPKIFSRLSASHIPYVGILFSSACTAIAVVINYLVPNEAFMRVMAVATAAAAIAWAMIVLVNLKFRKAHAVRADKLIFRSPFYPYSNYLCLAFLGFLICLMVVTGFTSNGFMTALFTKIGILASDQPALLSMKVPDMSLSVLVIPIWIAVLYIGFVFKHRAK